MVHRTVHRDSVFPAGISRIGQTSDDWQPRVRTEVQAQNLDAAFAVVEQRLAQAPDDLEAHGWRGRLLAWKGHWPEAEARIPVGSTELSKGRGGSDLLV